MIFSFAIRGFKDFKLESCDRKERRKENNLIVEYLKQTLFTVIENIYR